MHLIYYRQVPNFGDQLNPWLFYTELPEAFGNLDATAAFIGIGTQLTRHLDKLKYARTIVFGSGCGPGPLPKIDERYDIWGVRGTLSARRLGLADALAIGDPAILLANRVSAAARQTVRGKISFMPHHPSDSTALRQLCEGMGLHYLSPLDEIERLVASIASSELVLCEAMHGAIVADALRVPWVPLANSRMNHFKWNDWCSMLDLEYAPVALTSLSTRPMLAPFNRLRARAIERDLASAKNRVPSLSPDPAFGATLARLETRLAGAEDIAYGWPTLNMTTRDYNQSSRLPRRVCGVRRREDRIGIVGPGYGYERVSYALPMRNFTFVRNRSLRIGRGSVGAYTRLVLDWSAALVHSWNAIICNRPFIVTFENELPRYLGDASDADRRRGYRRLAADDCRAILALSEIAATLGRRRAVAFGFPAVAAKIQTFLGGIEPTHLPPAAAAKAGPLKVLFVGNDAVRKGLLPVIEALTLARDGGLACELTVVSDLGHGSCYVFKEHFHATHAQLVAQMRQSWIKHLQAVPVRQVMEMMASSDLLAMPSFDESLGWAPLEAAAVGLPSVVTNVFALAESFQHRQDAWIVGLPLDDEARWSGLHLTGAPLQDAIKGAHKEIRDGVLAALLAAGGRRDYFQGLGARAADIIRPKYSPRLAADRLAGIYQDALR